MYRKYRGFCTWSIVYCTKYVIQKAIDRPTKTPLCDFAVATREPLMFCTMSMCLHAFPFDWFSQEGE